MPEASIALHSSTNRVDAEAILAREGAAKPLREAVAARLVSARGAVA